MPRSDIIDVTLDGRVLGPEPTPFSARLLRGAIIVAVLLGAAGVAFLALWLALLLIPIALAAAGVAWLAWRWRLWQERG